MIKSYNFNFNLNKFFRKIILKKQYLKKLAQKIALLKHIKEQSHKKLINNFFFKKQKFYKAQYPSNIYY